MNTAKRRQHIPLARLFSGAVLTFLVISFHVSSFAAGDDADSVEDLQKRVAVLEKELAEVQAMIAEYKRTHQEQKTQIEGKVGKVRARYKPGSVFAEPSMPGTLKIGANITGIVQGTPDAKLIGEQKESEVAGSYQANVTITNEFEGVDGVALANLRVGDGHGVEPKLTVYSNVDNNAWLERYFTLSEIFYQQNLFDKKVIINFGKLDPTVFFDLNKYAASDTTQFLARIFNNSPVIEFPQNSGGVRAAYYPADWLELQYLVMCGDSQMEELESRLFHIAGVAVSPEIYGRKGNYRLLGWVNNNQHLSWNDPSETQQYAYGFSISCDQEITDSFGIFGKFGWQDPKVYNPDLRAYPKEQGLVPDINSFSLEAMWSAGFQLRGKPWGREYDFLGVAVGQVIPSKDMKNAFDGLGDNRRDARNETHVETYYNFYVNKYLAISPGVQFIWDAYGGDAQAEEVVAVYTLRTHVDF